MAAVEGHELPKSVLRLFKKMQDALGLWHDYVVLAETAMEISVEEILAAIDPVMQQRVLDVVSLAIETVTSAASKVLRPVERARRRDHRGDPRGVSRIRGRSSNRKWIPILPAQLKLHRRQSLARSSRSFLRTARSLLECSVQTTTIPALTALQRIVMAHLAGEIKIAFLGHRVVKKAAAGAGADAARLIRRVRSPATRT